MVSNLTLNPWTKTDGMVITLISLWLHSIECNGKEHVHVSRLIREGFVPSIAYDFYDDLLRNGLAESYDETTRSTRPLLVPTAKGITTFLDVYRGRLSDKSKSNTSQIEIILLKEVCKALEKLQTLLFSSERH